MSTHLRIPKHRLQKIFKLRRDLSLNVELIGCLGVPVDTNVLEQLCRGFQEVLPDAIDTFELRRSLTELVGRTLTSADLEELCWRIAGNLSELVEGRPILSWTGHVNREEWVPLQVIDAQRSAVRTRRGMAGGTQFRVQALAGSPCPHVFEIFWSHRSVAVLASRLGFNLRDVEKPYAYSHPGQLVGCRFYALFSTAARNHALFSEVSPAKNTAAIWTWNRKVIAAREPARRKCPRGYPTSRPCFRCHLGTDQCPLATHAVTYVKKFCTHCARESWFNPQCGGDLCMDCTYQGLFPESSNVQTA